MLQVISPAISNCGSSRYYKSKCAEIHYQPSNFSILCISCGLTTKAYAEFLAHFQQQHLEQFHKEEIITTVFEQTEETELKQKHDPLEWEEKSEESLSEADDLLKKLDASQVEVKLETNKEGREDFNDSDDEILSFKLKVKKENEVYNAVDPTPDSTDSEGRQSPHLCASAALATDEIDWSKPYEPNLLKNHTKRQYKPRHKPNICSYCGRTFRRRYQLDTHLNIHTGSKPHQCEICGRLFRAVTTLTRHLNTHEQRQLYHCQYCEKAFTHKAALISHELRHTQERRIPCDECGKCFYTLNQMDTHKRKVHHKADDEELAYACELCTKRYRSASMLSTHKFKKHYRLAKYACEQCGKKFISEMQREAHQAIHVRAMNKDEGDKDKQQ